MRTLLILAMLSLPFLAVATNQEPDILLFDGKVLTIDADFGSLPLEQYFKNGSERPRFAGGMSTSLRREYIAHWEIREKRLYLKGLNALVYNKDGNTTRPHELAKLFPNDYRSGEVFAAWYTGNVVSMTGSLKLVFVFANGVLKEIIVPNNTPDGIQR